MSAIEIITENLLKAAAKAEQEWLINATKQILQYQAEHPGDEFTEEILHGVLGMKNGGGAKTKKKAAEAKDTCTAALWARSKGEYETSRCGKANCERDDGQGNLLCKKCGENWDTVSQVTKGGKAISYGKDCAHSGGAIWMGIWREKWEDSDVPPVFKGQRCCVLKDEEKVDINKSFKKLKLEQGGNTWHQPLTPWTGTEEAKETEELQEDTSKLATEEEDYMHEGLLYVKVEHEGEQLLYPRWGDKQPDSSNPELAWAQLEDGTIEFLASEFSDAHIEAKTE